MIWMAFSQRAVIRLISALIAAALSWLLHRYLNPRMRKLVPYQIIVIYVGVMLAMFPVLPC